LLNEKQIDFEYREYTKNPLTKEELIDVLSKLGCSAKDVLRSREAKLHCTGDESEAQLIEMIALNPRLLQRPIGILGNRAVVGRPPDNLLELL
jgi:arsenate reductase (glutaredoxin)